MGFSPSGFQDTEGNEFHWETSGMTVVLWNADESKVILRVTYEEARKLLDGIDLLCSLHEHDE